MKLIHNGILEVDHIRPKEVTKLDDYLPSSWFGPFSENNGTVSLDSSLKLLLNCSLIKVWFDCHEKTESLRLDHGQLH